MSFSDYELDADLEAGQGNKIGALYEEVETSTFKSKVSGLADVAVALQLTFWSERGQLRGFQLPPKLPSKTYRVNWSEGVCRVLSKPSSKINSPFRSYQ